MDSKNKYKIAVTYNEIFVKDFLDIKEVKETAERIVEILSKDFDVELLPLSNDIVPFVNELKKISPHAIFNLCEAFADKSIGEMFVASIYELIGIPYTGSPPLTIGICLNKMLAKKILIHNGLPTPPGFLLHEIEKIEKDAFPLILKPISEDGSVGIFKENVIFNRSELKNKVEKILSKINVPMFLEKFVDGRELNISFLGGEPLCIGEIIFKIYPPILTYDGKWSDNSEDDLGTIPNYPADLKEEEREKIIKIAKEAYYIFSLRDYARVDMRMDEKGEVFIIDINPNPDLSEDAGFSRALKAKGIKYEEGIRRITEFALKRGNIFNK